MLDLDADADVGIQIYGSRSGAVFCDEAVGSALPGVPLCPSTMFSLWCTTKPVAAVFLLTLAEREGFTLDSPLADLLADGRTRPPAAVTLRSLLDHSAGLGHPSAVEVMITSPAGRRSAVDAAAARAVPAPAYSEFVAWDLVSRAITTLSGTRATVAIDRWLGALGLSEELVFDCTGLPARRIGAFHLRHDGEWYPLGQDHQRRLQGQDRISLGGYASARGVGRFYELLLTHLDHPVAGVVSPGVLRDTLSRPRASVHDETLGRVCTFAGGFMVDLAEHGYGELPSPASFGHSGFMGSSAGFADPASGTVLVVARSALSFDEQWAATRRRELFDLAVSSAERRDHAPVG